ncbi:thiopurine S-methyltransferase [Arhodomonas sp. SL1]|uniref:thiopurine S-methyltransferase n=1 Tax=Arhodomonas sp. SL1 TaxID=3425691 RepID=UPI003F882C1D
MDAAFWYARWERGEIGFHQRDINRWLRRYWPGLGLPDGSTVFVPLCGASLDMAWLAARGHRVVGIEIAPGAIQRFFAEQGWQVRRQPGRIPFWESGPVRLYEGDFFDLTPEDLPGVAAIYDRAALIALPPEQRPAYARHLATLLPGGSDGLLITMDYDQAEMRGPPFSVPEPEVRALFADGFEVERLIREDTLERHEGFRRRGMTTLHELVFRLRRNG